MATPTAAAANTTTKSNNENNLYCAIGSETTSLSDEDIRLQLTNFLTSLGPREDILLIPPDYTRFHSQAGKVTKFIAEHYGFIIPETSSKTTTTKQKKEENVKPKIQILPALGTHVPMTQEQVEIMFGKELAEMTNPSPFLVHDWRKDVVTIGHAPAEMVQKATNGMVNRPWPAQLNRLVWSKRKSSISSSSQSSTTTTQKKRPSLILSIGQVVPHEVMGMANFNKNLFVGVGGVEAINLSHFIGAVHGMERMMGRANNPLRSILNYCSTQYLQNELDLWYILTVMGTNPTSPGQLEMRGLFIGRDIECYNRACDLSLRVNFTLLDEPLKNVVVYLDEHEYHSTWLGNKAIYRTRMAIADGGHLLILAPGISRFGEDETVDKLIRANGYFGTSTVMNAMAESTELRENLSAVAHLIHGSTEGRFTVTYCPGHYLTTEEIEGVGYRYGNLEHMMSRYGISRQLKDGWNQVVIKNENGDEVVERFFYISNPALGLWAYKGRFEESSSNKQEIMTTTTTTASSVTMMSPQDGNDGSGGVGGWAKSSTPAPKSS